MRIAGIGVTSRAFQDRISISCMTLVGTKEMCCQESECAVSDLAKIQSAILLAICRPEANLVGEIFVFSKFWCSIKIIEEKRKFFSQNLIYFRFVSVL